MVQRRLSIGAVLRATRPSFLVLAPLSVLLGVLLAARQMIELDRLEIALALAGGVLAHAAVNLFNEHDDFCSGLDHLTRRTPFSGGSGALPESPDAAPAVLVSGILSLAGVVAIGGYFLWLRGWPMLVVGLLGVYLVVAYTRWITRRPWYCLLAPGLGFGPVMVLGTLVALGGRVDAAALVVATASLLLVSELLLLNQFPDLEADRRNGRRHLPIVLGLRRVSWLVIALLLGAYMLIALGQLGGLLPASVWLAWLPLPAALWVAWKLPGALEEHQALLGVMGVNVVVLLSSLALLAAGLWLG